MSSTSKSAEWTRDEAAPGPLMPAMMADGETADIYGRPLDRAFTGQKRAGHAAGFLASLAPEAVFTWCPAPQHFTGKGQRLCGAGRDMVPISRPTP